MIRRPVLRWHGGKWKLAPWIVENFPPHRIYTEAFGGAASVLMRKPRSYAEIYNDLDGEVVNVFEVLRDPKSAAELEHLIRLTPFAREEFVLSYSESEDPIEQARRTIVRSFMGFGSNSHNRPTGFRSNSNRNGTTPAHDWAHYPEQIAAFVDRLQGVCIENRPAIEVIQAHDSSETLHYVDPPYVHDTRAANMQGNYRFEMTDDEHAALAGVLNRCAGIVIVSGYESELYKDLYSSWHVTKRAAHADGAKDRIEVLWSNRLTATLF